MRPTYTAYPLFSRKYYRPLLYSTLLYSTLIRCTDAIFFSLTPLQDDAGWAQMQGGEREGETSNSPVQLFPFFLLVLFFPSRFFFVSFFFFSLPCFFRPLAPPLLEVHAIVARKCKMRMACSDAFVGRMMARRDRKQPCWFFASMEHRGTVIVVALLLYCFSDNSDLFILI